MRRRCVTEKVKTRFGSMYCHLELDKFGHAVGLSFSTPGKCRETELDKIVLQLGEAADSLIKEANGGTNGPSRC